MAGLGTRYFEGPSQSNLFCDCIYRLVGQEKGLNSASLDLTKGNQIDVAGRCQRATKSQEQAPFPTSSALLHITALFIQTGETLLPQHKTRQASALKLFTHLSPWCNQGRSCSFPSIGSFPTAHRSSPPQELLRCFVKGCCCHSQRWLKSSAGQNTPL